MKKILAIGIVVLQCILGVHAQTELRTAEQFKFLDSNGNYILMADVDLSSIAFVPIGGYFGSFNGTFDGNGHTITIGWPVDDCQYRGLFSIIGSKGVVKNVIVDGSLFSSGDKSSWVGAIAGENYGTIINCVSYVSVNSTGVTNNNPKYHCTGGIAGMNSGTISYCVVASHVSGADLNTGTGGIVGTNRAYTNGDQGRIENCIYASDAIGAGGVVYDQTTKGCGMICGSITTYAAGFVKNCYYKENDAVHGFGGDVSDDSHCFGLTIEGFRSLVREGGLYASTEYELFKKSILSAVAPVCFFNIDTQLTGGYSTFYHGDSNYSVSNNEIIYTGVIKDSKLVLTALNSRIIPKGLPVVIKSKKRYFTLTKSYEEVSCTCENDLEGSDTEFICQPDSNYVLSSDNGVVGFGLFNGSTINANTAYIPWRKDMGNCKSLSFEITEPSPAITFSDDQVKTICLQRWDFNGDGELNEDEAAAVNDLGTAFKGKMITSFNEFKYFTGVTSIGNEAFRGCTGLTSIEIPNSVTSIGSYAFSGCTGFASIDIPNSVTSIGNYAFNYCTSLESFKIHNSLTSVGAEAFYNCTSLASVHISDLASWCNINFAGITANPLYYAHHLFLNGKELTDLIIPGNVTSVGRYTFYNCTGLTSIEIPNSVTSIGTSAFAGCTGLTDVISQIENPFALGQGAFSYIGNCLLTVPDGTLDTYIAAGWTKSIFKDGVIEASVSNEEPIVFADALVKQLCISRWDRNKDRELSKKEAALVSSLNSTFIGYPEIRSFDELEYFVGLTSIDQSAFSGCTGLTSIKIPDNVTSIKYDAFEGCTSLTTITIPCRIKEILYNPFSNCTGLKSIKVASGNEVYDSRDNCNAIIETATNSLIIGCRNTIIPNSVKSIGDNAFKGCTGLTSIEIPNSVTSISTRAFNQSGLTSIVVANGNTKYDSRDNCNAVIETATNTLIIGCVETIIPSNVTSVGSYAFFNCTGLTSIEIPNSITSIEERAFYNCPSLKSIVSLKQNPFVLCNGSFVGVSDKCVLIIPDGTRNKYIAAGWTEEIFKGGVLEESESYVIAFADDNVKAICVSNWDKNSDGELNVKEVAEVTDLGTVFTNNKAIKSFNELKYFTGLEIIGRSVFSGCTNLLSVNLPDNLTTISESAFSGCKGLSYIDFPNSLNTIGNGAFDECSGLTYIVLPEHIVSVGSYAFAGCKNMMDVYCYATSVPSTGRDPFSNVATATLHIPEASIGAYQVANFWRDFCNIVKIMPLFTLTYMIDDEDYMSYKVEEGAKIIPLVAPTKEGYTLEWKNLPETMPANDVVVTGSFIANSYTVTFMYGDEVLHTEKVNYGESIPLPDIEDKYGFVYKWLDVPETMPAHDIILQVDETDGIFGLETQKQAKEYYQLNGLRTDKPQKSINIIRMSDGTTRKVMMK